MSRVGKKQHYHTVHTNRKPPKLKADDSVKLPQQRIALFAIQKEIMSPVPQMDRALNRAWQLLITFRGTPTRVKRRERRYVRNMVVAGWNRLYLKRSKDASLRARLRDDGT